MPRRRALSLIQSLESRCLLSTGASSAPRGAAAVPPARQVEALDRGVVALYKGSGNVYVDWRLLGTDPTDIAFNVYRSSGGATPVKLNASPITTTTDFSDTAVNTAVSNDYFVRPVSGGVEQAASEAFTLPAGAAASQHLDIPLTPPDPMPLPDDSTYTYNANDASAGDLDGDGQYEIVLKWDPSDSKDSSQDGFTGPTYFDAYKLDGTRLWRINLGQNIRAGAHYTQFIVYDLDGDGKAEVVMKTAPGTIDGQGNPVLLPGDHVTDDYRDPTTGRINSGPEYLTVFNGQTGAAMATVPFKPDRINTSSWGDDYGNRQDRILMAVAYLDGQRPSLVVGRGIFPGQTSSHAVRNELTAWDWRNGQLSMRWWFRADKNTSAYGLPNINTAYVGQGNYEMQPADVDGDGRDEIVYGSMTVDDNGAPLYSTGLGHGDALAVTSMDPNRSGEQVYMPMETPGGNGHVDSNVHDAATGAVIFDTTNLPNDPDVGRGNSFDIDPRYPGFENWDSNDPDIYNINGTDIQAKPSNMFINFGIWWDADPMRELLDGTTISDYRINPTTGLGGRANYVFAPSGLAANNGTKNTPCLVADLFGDWREEVVWRRADNLGLQIWSTTIPATNRIVTLMHDVQYRESVAWQNVGYNQPTATSFYLGSIESTGTQFPPIPPPNVYAAPLDVTPPSVISRQFLYETGHAIALQFSEPINPATLSASDLVVQSLSDGSAIDPQSVSYDPVTHTATFTFSPLLPDGNYAASMLAGAVTDLANNATTAGTTLGFFVLAGDANRDRSVDTTDFNVLAANFGATGRTFSQGNFNYDSSVDTIDFNILAAHFGQSLPPAAPASAVALASSAPPASDVAIRPSFAPTSPRIDSLWSSIEITDSSLL